MRAWRLRDTKSMSFQRLWAVVGNLKSEDVLLLLWLLDCSKSSLFWIVLTSRPVVLSLCHPMSLGNTLCLWFGGKSIWYIGFLGDLSLDQGLLVTCPVGVHIRVWCEKVHIGDPFEKSVQRSG